MNDSLMERIDKAEENLQQVTRARSAKDANQQEDVEVQSTNMEGQEHQNREADANNKERQVEERPTTEKEQGVVPRINVIGPREPADPTEDDEEDDVSWKPPASKSPETLEEEEGSILATGSIAEGDNLMVIQAEINFLYSTGKFNEGAALLAATMDRTIPARQETPLQESSRQAQLRNIGLNQPTQSPLINQQQNQEAPARRERSPYRLIQENMSDAITEPFTREIP